jgi:hypothetical protein
MTRIRLLGVVAAAGLLSAVGCEKDGREADEPAPLPVEGEAEPVAEAPPPAAEPAPSTTPPADGTGATASPTDPMAAGHAPAAAVEVTALTPMPIKDFQSEGRALPMTSSDPMQADVAKLLGQMAAAIVAVPNAPQQAKQSAERIRTNADKITKAAPKLQSDLTKQALMDAVTAVEAIQRTMPGDKPIQHHIDMARIAAAKIDEGRALTEQRTPLREALMHTADALVVASRPAQRQGAGTTP